MKRKIEEGVLVQKYEIAQILHGVEDLPKSVADEIADNGGLVYMSNLSDGLRFDHLFEEPESVEWLMGQDWILDYDEYSNMELPELQTRREALKKEIDDDVATLNSDGGTYGSGKFCEAKSRLDRLNHKLTSLDAMIAEREGRIIFTFLDDDLEDELRGLYDERDELAAEFFNEDRKHFVQITLVFLALMAFDWGGEVFTKHPILGTLLSMGAFAVLMYYVDEVRNGKM